MGTAQARAKPAFGWTKGDRCEVFSTGKQRWFSGIVLSVPEATNHFRFKVTFYNDSGDRSVKEVGLDQVNAVLRPVREAAPCFVCGKFEDPLDPMRTGSTTARGFFCGPQCAFENGSGWRGKWGRLAAPQGEVPLCETPGCEKQRQPGRDLRNCWYKYCCKSCSQGSDCHDPNCEGRRGEAAATLEHDGLAWFKGMAGGGAALLAHLDGIYDEALRCGGYEQSLPIDAAIGLIFVELLRPVTPPHAPRALTASPKTVQSWKKLADPRETGLMPRDAFRKLGKSQLVHTMRRWYPEYLPTSTQEFVRRNPDELESVYQLGEELGAGAFGVVRMAKHRTSGEARVCKTLRKTSAEEQREELEILALLDHPHVIRVCEFFEDDESFHMIMELCGGGTLEPAGQASSLQNPSTANVLPEASAAVIMRQALRAIAYCHERERPVMHKDLKLENIMFLERGSLELKVIDFGVGQILGSRQASTADIAGSCLYLPPEALSGDGAEVTVSADVWALGVILYVLLTGTWPCYVKQVPGFDVAAQEREQAAWQEEILERIRSWGEVDHPPLRGVGDSGMDLLRGMLRRDPGERLSAVQCLEHPWFQEFPEAPPRFTIGVGQNMYAYCNMSRVKQALFLLAVTQCTPTAHAELSRVFNHYSGQDGTLAVAKVQKVLRRSGMYSVFAQRAARALDLRGRGLIGWTEFLAGALCLWLKTNERLGALRAAFRALAPSGALGFGRCDVVEIFAPELPAGAEEDSTAERARLRDSWKQAVDKVWSQLAGQGEELCTEDAFMRYMRSPECVLRGDQLFAVTGEQGEEDSEASP